MELVSYEQVMRGIRKKREELGMTQRELADRSDISPSQLNRMERGTAEANYSTVFQVWEQVRLAEQERAETAGELKTDKVRLVGPDEPVETAAELMHSNDFSQLPVLEDGEVVGSVTEKDVLESGDADEKVREVMGEEPPEVSPGTGRGVVKELLLDGNPMVLVEEDETLGVITKADLL